MNIPFACPACGASGSLDRGLIGRQVRCKHCQHRSVVPDPDVVVEDGYAIEGSGRKDVEVLGADPSSNPVFVSSRGDEPRVQVSPRKPRATRPKKRRAEGPGFDWRAWSIRVGIAAAVVVVLISILAPRGLVIGGLIVAIVGTLMALIGFGAGAFGAFSEDFLYGFFYLVFPIYTAYYLVTRWDDLRAWAICSTSGVGLILLGTQMLGWAGVAD